MTKAPKKSSNTNNILTQNRRHAIQTAIVAAVLSAVVTATAVTQIYPRFASAAPDTSKPAETDRASARDLASDSDFYYDDSSYVYIEGFYESVSGMNDTDVKYGEYKIDADYYPAQPDDEIFPCDYAKLCVSVKTRKLYIPEDAEPSMKPLTLTMITYNGSVELQPDNIYSNIYEGGSIREGETVVWNYDYVIKPEIKLKGISASIDTDIGTQTEYMSINDIAYSLGDV